MSQNDFSQFYLRNFGLYNSLIRPGFHLLQSVRLTDIGFLLCSSVYFWLFTADTYRLLVPILLIAFAKSA